jgi:hypothetical protein
VSPARGRTAERTAERTIRGPRLLDGTAPGTAEGVGALRLADGEHRDDHWFPPRMM